MGTHKNFTKRKGLKKKSDKSPSSVQPASRQGHVNQVSGPAGPSTVSRPWSSLEKRDRQMVMVTLALLAGVLLLVSIRGLTGHTLAFDLTRESDIRQWGFSGQGTRQHFSPEWGLEFINKVPYYVFSPEFNTPGDLEKSLSWESHPYIKLTIKSSTVQRRAGLLWFSDPDHTAKHYFQLIIPANSETVIINTRQTIPWQRRFPAKGTIHQFGLHFFDSMTIKSIALQSTLTPVEYLELIVRDFTTLETFLPSAINFLYGPRILGVPLGLCLGLMMLLPGVLFLIHNSRFTRGILIAACLFCVVVYDAHFGATLFEQARLSRRFSAWQPSHYRECQVRYGDAFADLARQVETHVPQGATLFCTWDRSSPFPRETNWMSFYFFSRYRCLTEDKGDPQKQSDFIVYYYPYHHRFSKTSGKVYPIDNPDGGVMVELIAEISSEARLFRVIHD